VGNRGGGACSCRGPECAPLPLPAGMPGAFTARSVRAPDGHTSCLGHRRGRHRPSAHAGYLQAPDRGGHPYAGEE